MPVVLIVLAAVCCAMRRRRRKGDEAAAVVASLSKWIISYLTTSSSITATRVDQERMAGQRTLGEEDGHGSRAAVQDQEAAQKTEPKTGYPPTRVRALADRHRRRERRERRERFPQRIHLQKLANLVKILQLPDGGAVVRLERLPAAACRASTPA